MKKTSKRTAASRKRSPARRAPKRKRASAKPPHESALVAFAELAATRSLRWYVFGAQAVNLHGFPRATADLDLTVELELDRLPGFITGLERAGFRLRSNDRKLMEQNRVIQVAHEKSGLPVDLVLAGPGLEQQFLDELTLLPLGRRKIPVLSPENLVVTKVLAGRPKDLEDVRELVARRPDLDHARVEALLSQLEQALGQSDLLPLYRRLRS